MVRMRTDWVTARLLARLQLNFMINAVGRPMADFKNSSIFGKSLSAQFMNNMGQRIRNILSIRRVFPILTATASSASFCMS
jgi:hypothetical protein